MLILSRGPNVYYSFQDLTERSENVQVDDFFKALLPITSDSGMVNILQDINDEGDLKAEYGKYKSNYVDFSLQTAEEITKVGSNVLVSRISSGKEGYKIIDIYIDETNSELITTVPVFKNAQATSLYQKGEDVFSEGVDDYAVNYYDKDDKPDIYTINGITVPFGTVGATKFKYLMSFQTFKPVNFEEFTVKIGKVNFDDKLTISENSYLNDTVITNKFIKVEIYDKNYTKVETFVGTIEAGHLDMNNNEYYIEEVVNKKSGYIYITGLTTETVDITTNELEAISSFDDMYFTNNTTIEYDVLVKSSTPSVEIGKVFNDVYNNKKVLFADELSNKYLGSDEFVYTDYTGDSEDGYIDNTGSLTSYVNDGTDDYFVVKEKANNIEIKSQSTYNVDSTTSATFTVTVDEDGVVTLDKAIGNDTLNSVKTEFNAVLSDINYSDSLIDKVDYFSENDTIDITGSFVTSAVTSLESESGSISVNTVTRQITFTDVTFDLTGLVTEVSDVTIASIENQDEDTLKVIKTKELLDETATKIVVNGTIGYTVSVTDKVANLLSGTDVASSLTVEIVGTEETLVNVVNVSGSSETDSATIVTDLNTYYNFNLRNTYNLELNADIDPYYVEGLKEIYSNGGAKNILRSRELNFFFMLDAVLKDLTTWETYQSSLNAIVKERKDCIGVLFGKNFTLSDINTINEQFDIDGSIDVNGLTRFTDYGNEFVTMLGMYYEDTLESGKKVKVPSLGYFVGRWLLGLYTDKNFITAGEESTLNRFDKTLSVSVDEEAWDVIDKLKINIPVKVKGVGTYMWFTNTTYNKNSDLKELNNIFTLVYLIRQYYPILIRYIHKRFIDRLTGTNYVVQMKNEMLNVLNEPTVARAFAEEPVLKMISTDEELENGIIVWSHRVKFSKKMKAVEVKFIFEKSGSIYIDLLQDV